MMLEEFKMSNINISKKLDAVIKSARSILGEKNFTESARAIFNCCCEITGATAGYVALLNEDGSENEVLFLESGGLPCSVNPELPMPVRGLRALSYETHKAVFDNNFMNSQWEHYLPEGHVDLYNVMFAPLNIQNKTVGIIGLANKPSDFTDEDAEIASVLGDLAAIALENSRYLELLNNKTADLEKAFDEIKTLKGIVPICMHCKGIRDDQGYWNELEQYISEHSNAQFSHGICEKCMNKYYSNNNKPN